MIGFAEALAAGILPKKKDALRFAVGTPDGLTSNSWKIWTSKSGVYVACRDDAKESKLSLHTSGRWRHGYIEEGFSQIAPSLPPNQNRAWDVWDEPAATLPETVKACKLVFKTSELTVEPEQRNTSIWKKNTLLIQPGPPGKLVVVHVFISAHSEPFRHATEPTIPLAIYKLADGRNAQILARTENENLYDDDYARAITGARAEFERQGATISPNALGHFVGTQHDGCRYLFSARVGDQ